MLHALVIGLLFGGQCNSNACVKQVQLQAVQAPVYYPQQYWYVAGQEALAEQRLRKLEEIQEQNLQLMQMQVQILQQQQIGGMQVSKLDYEARAILTANCTKCHKPGNTKGGVDLTGEIPTGLKLLCEDLVQSGEMPQAPAEMLSEDDIATISAWAHEDRVAVRAHLKSQMKPPEPLE